MADIVKEVTISGERAAKLAGIKLKCDQYVAEVSLSDDMQGEWTLRVLVKDVVDPEDLPF
jgi:hypothetical protein